MRENRETPRASGSGRPDRLEKATSYKTSTHASGESDEWAGSAYLSGGGFGLWELAFCTVLTICAYNGLRSYRFIGIGWLLHTGWDILHHLYGNPLLPCDPTSSLGCAICDPVIAAWCFAGAPSLVEVIQGRRIRQNPHTV